MSVPKPLEKDIQAACLQYLNALPGAVAWRMNTGAHRNEETGSFVRYGTKGQSDIIGILSGRFLAVEVKRPGNVPTIHQHGFLEVVRSYGGVGIWVTSLDDLIAQLEGIR